MKLYLSIIGIGTVIIAFFNAIFAQRIGFTVEYAVSVSVVSVVACIGIDAIVALIVRAFPQKNYDPGKSFFRERKGECLFYERLGINKWKDKIPEMGKLLVKFGKSKVEQKDNAQYLYKFLTEIGYAEIMHWISTVAGYLVIFILPLQYAPHIGIPVATVNFFLHIPPALVQRYNRPRLLRIYKRVLDKAANNSSAQTITNG